MNYRNNNCCFPEEWEIEQRCNCPCCQNNYKNYNYDYDQNDYYDDDYQDNYYDNNIHYGCWQKDCCKNRNKDHERNQEHDRNRQCRDRKNEHEDKKQNNYRKGCFCGFFKFR